MSARARQPVLIVVGGPNGSGKTTVTEKLLKHEWGDGCVYINPDYIARDDFGDWNSPEAVRAAANKAAEIREQCLKDRRSMAFETVMSAEDKVDFVRRAKAAGFFVRLFFVCTNDPSINAQRVALRVMEGGHDVPIPKIISRYYKSIGNCAELVPLVNRAYFYDNSKADADAKLMFRSDDGEVKKIYGDIEAWVLPIFEMLRLPHDDVPRGERLASEMENGAQPSSRATLKKIQ